MTMNNVSKTNELIARLTSSVNPLSATCGECGSHGESGIEWPCPTVAALDGAPEPEWEYGLLNPQAPDGGKLQDGAHLISDNHEHIIVQQRRSHPAIQAVRRRKAGPWVPLRVRSEA